jgi:hypothetical protein
VLEYPLSVPMYLSGAAIGLRRTTAVPIFMVSNGKFSRVRPQRGVGAASCG